MGQKYTKKHKLINDNDCFSDHFAEFHYIDSIKRLDKKYPDSLFILNYRNLQDYMNSLLRHLLWGNILNNKLILSNNWRWDHLDSVTLNDCFLNVS